MKIILEWSRHSLNRTIQELKPVKEDSKKLLSRALNRTIQELKQLENILQFGGQLDALNRTIQELKLPKYPNCRKDRPYFKSNPSGIETVLLMIIDYLHRIL